MHDPVEDYQASGKIQFACLECPDVTWVTWKDRPDPCFCCEQQGAQKWKIDEIRLAEKLQQSTL